ncbi:Serine/threonine-protein kinase SAK, partial [Intoshia linei]
MAPSSIEDFETKNLLGYGGFANVYLAKNKITNVNVAIKMIDIKKMRMNNMMKRVKEEVGIHCRLKHPSICECYDVFQDTNYVYLILEYCSIGEFLHYLRQLPDGKLSEMEAAKFFEQILQGVMYLHTHKVLHRDLSLSNLLMTKDKNIKIADFGLATLLDESNSKKFTICGTPNYISPEVASKNAHGLESDVWSLGIMLYTMLTGCPPFDMKDVRVTLKKVILGKFTMPNYISYHAQSLIASLLKTDPDDRILLNDILKHPFLTQNLHKMNVKQFNGSMDSGRYTINGSSNGADVNTGLYKTEESPIIFENSFKNNNTNSNKHSNINVSSSNIGNFIPSSHSSKHENRSTGSKCMSHQHSSTSSLQNANLNFQNNSFSKRYYSTDDNYQLSNDFNMRVDILPPVRIGSVIHGVSTMPVDLTLPSFNESTSYKNVNNTNSYYSNCTFNKPTKPLNIDGMYKFDKKTNSARIKLIPDSHLLVEFLKNRKKIPNFMIISKCGSLISIYSHVVDEYNPRSINNSLVETYHLTNLPKLYWKKYTYCYKIVDLIRSKWPRITIYNDLGKFILMENLPVGIFVCKFYSGN